ncbi:MAG: hypothetical protein ACJ8DJ_03540 [Gemmatimonadales bacterium]
MTHTLLLGLAVVACERPRDVAVRVSIPGPDSLETPVTGVGLVALPYDRDSVLKSLEVSARTPRPHVAALDTLFREFRGPFTAYSAATFRLGKLRDSVAEVKTALDSLPRNAPGYAVSYARFGRLSDTLKAAQARAESARGALNRARVGFVARSDSLRAEVRSWEDSTYRGYDSIVHNLAARQHREPVTDTTGSDGWAHLRVAPGRWWIYARSWDATDPNAEWYWNVPLTGDTLLLSSRTGRRQPRY